MSQSNKVIYKYVDQDGARKIIANKSLRFGRPSNMNDPFDVYIEDLFNVGIDKIHQQWVPSFLDSMQRDPLRFAADFNLEPMNTIGLANMLKLASPDDRAELISLARVTIGDRMDGELKEQLKHVEGIRQRLVAQFENSGIFCATFSKENLLMWAHYAQQHRGVVLGFMPDVGRDSFLRIAKPVIYTDTRPSFYGTVEKMIIGGAKSTQKELRDFRDSLIYSKSTHWRYEEEIRIDIPHAVPVGQLAIFRDFYSNELCELYLGVRASEPFRSEIMGAARRLNPGITIFDAQLEKGSYALAFEAVS